MIALYGLVGLVLALASFILAFVYPYYHLIGFFLAGAWLFVDSIALKLTNHSLLSSLIKKPLRNLLCVGIGGIVLGVIVEFFGVAVLDLWRYFVFSMQFNVITSNNIILQSFKPSHFVLILLGWVLLAGIFYETYRALHKALHKRLKLKIKRLTKKLNTTLFSSVGVLGLILFVGPIVSRVLGYKIFFDYLLYLAGIWLILEYVAYKLARKSLLEQALKGNLAPIVSALLSLIVLVFVEVMNVPISAWAFNSAVMGPAILGLPAFILLIWPLGGLAIFSSYSILCNDPSLWKP